MDDLHHSRTVTRRDAYTYDDHALLHTCQAQEHASFGNTEASERHAKRAARCERRAKRIRAGVVITARRNTGMAAVPAPVRTGPRPRGAGRPAARRAAGSRSGSEPGSSDPDKPPSPPSTTESLRLLAERLRALDAFVAQHGLDFWDRRRPENGDQLLRDEELAA